MKFLLLEGIHDIAYKQLSAKSIQVDQIKNTVPVESIPQKDIVGLGIRSRTQITKSILKSFSQSLQVIGAFCIGTDQIDLKAAHDLGIPVFNAPYGNTRSVAELVIGSIIALSRKSHVFNLMMHQQKWHKSSQGSREVRNKTLGIVGYGRIGTQVGILAEAMGMQVFYFDIKDVLPIGNVKSARTLKELFSVSDFVTIHVPETPMTKNMIQSVQLQWLKKGASLINTSRGSVVNLIDLKKVLDKGYMSGAAIDVFPQEPEKKEDIFVTELQGMNNVVLSPHIAGSTEEAQANIAEQVSKSLIKFLFQGVSEGAVNFPILNPPVLEEPEQYQRIINVHRNVPGVLGSINGMVSRFKINIKSQLLATDSEIGYLVMDMENKHKTQVSNGLEYLELCAAIDSLEFSIRTDTIP